MAEKGHWKFREINPTTGNPYFDWVPDTEGGKKQTAGSSPNITPPPTEPAPLSPGERGSFNADIVSQAMEKRDQQKEATARQVKGLPPED